MDLDKFQQKLDQEYQDFKNKVEKPNILLIGGTGVGKSSLINTCFGSELTQVGVGKPVTQHMDSYACDGVPIVLFDSKGYEIGSDKEKAFLEEIIAYTTNFKTGQDAIHIAWYCIQASGSRITDFDISIIKKIQQAGLPVAIVLTKSDLISDDDAKCLRSVLENALPDIQIFETSIREDLEHLQLYALCEWSVDNLPDGLKISFVAAQRKNIRLKREEASKIIKQHSAGSGFVGFTPIPFSDAPILIANQAGMVARILFIYDLQSLAGQIKDLIGGALIGSLISESGAWLASQFIKMLPGVGTFFGGLINGTVAASITFAIGTAVSEICAVFSEKVIDGNTKEIKAFLDNMGGFFTEQVMKNFERK